MITVLTGENSYLIKTSLKKLVDLFVSEFGDMGLDRIEADEASYDRIRESLESLPFLAPKKLVVILSPTANKELIDKAPDLLANLPETTKVVLVDSKLDKRTGFYKFLKKNGDIKEFKNLEGFGLVKWLTARTKELGGELSAADAKLLVDKAGQDQQLLENELQKLLNYDSYISKQSIDLLVEASPQSKIFDLLDAAMAGQAKKTVMLYEEQRAMRVEPQQILAMLAWQLHILTLVKAAGSRSPATVASESKVNPYVVSKTKALASKLSTNEVKKIVSSTLDLDIKLKSQPIDADEALLDLLLNLKAK